MSDFDTIRNSPIPLLANIVLFRLFPYGLFPYGLLLKVLKRVYYGENLALFRLWRESSPIPPSDGLYHL